LGHIIAQGRRITSWPTLAAEARLAPSEAKRALATLTEAGLLSAYQPRPDLDLLTTTPFARHQRRRLLGEIN
jgi:DNA-binding IclR family transcriptional regulator